MNPVSPIVLFGGAFDPIHRGHLSLAQWAYTSLKARAVHFLPVGIPPHRTATQAPFHHRLAMVRAALAEEIPEDELEINPRFIASSADAPREDGVPNYTHTLLTHYRRQHPETPLIWLMGADAFTHLPSWHQWQNIPKLAHLAIGERPGQNRSPHAWTNTLTEPLKRWWQNRTPHPESLMHPIDAGQHGAIVMLTAPALPYASRTIRHALAENINDARSEPDLFCARLGLSPAVLRYLLAYGLYTH